MNLVQSAQNAQHARNLADLFAACSIDATVTYAQMKSVVGFDPQAKRYLISAAIKLANAEYGIVVKPVVNVGYQRISDGVSLGAAALDKARRATKRGKSTVKNWMDKANLDDDQLRRGYSVVTQLGIVEHMSSRRAAPDLSKVDLSTYRAGDDAKNTLAAIKAARERRAG